MHLETLSLYCDVVRLRSFSRGAEQNFVSQSAASQAVQQLERELGVSLIDRTRRPFVVTPEGEALDRKSTRLNSSHLGISYAVFCLKKKTNKMSRTSVDK